MSARSRIFRQRRLPSTRPLAALVAALFANGEQGLWYDIEGFRDAWNSVGPELVTNGDFSAGTAGWSLGAGLSVSGGALVAATTSNQTATQAIPSVVAGKWYMVSVTVTAYTSGNVRVNVGGSLAVVPAPALLGLRQVLVQAGSIDTNFRIYPGDVSVGGTSTLDNISVREWLGAATSTLYQDATGALPAYMPGQGQVDPPIGLLLDKRKGLAKGIELVGNGGFDTDLSGWNQSVANYWQWSAGRAYHPPGSNYCDLTVTVPTTPGWVVIEFDYTVLTAAGSAQWFYINGAGTGVTYVQGLQLLPAGSGRVRYIARDGVQKVGFARYATAEFLIDNVTVKALPGNHGYQTTTTGRALLSARYNLLVKTESVSNAVWSKFTGGTGSAPVVTENYGLSPRGDMTADRVVFSRGAGTTSSDYSLVSNATTSLPSAIRTIRSIWLKSNTGANQSVALYDGVQNVGAPVTVTPEWKQFFVTGGTAASSSSIAVGTRGGGSWLSNYDSDLDILVWGADIRPENDGVGLPSYQQVEDASTYDTAGFPLYLRPDGVDDGMQVPGLDLSASSQALVAFAIRKLSDAAVGELLGFSATPNTSAGAFGVLAPPGANSPRIEVSAFAVGNGYVQIASAAPESAVFSALINLGVATVAEGKVVVRKNGAAASPLATGAGTGTATLGNYTLYLFRRGGTSLPFGGRFYGLLIRAGTITDSQIANVERLLDQRGRLY